MKKVAIFMSDFHLGQKDMLEEFFADEEFAELVARLSQAHQGDKVDLVLLGDIMDLWTTSLDPQEQHAETLEGIQLYFPAGDDQEKKEAREAEEKKIRTIAAAHKPFFEALGRFLSDDPVNRCIVYVPGNHDHSLVDPTLQNVIREQIVTTELRRAIQCNYPELNMTQLRDDQLVKFQLWYDDKELQVYAEHGNQLTYGGTFRYENFGNFGDECPGYYQFKLVSNRLERRAPELNSVFMQIFEPAMWPGIMLWLLLKFNIRAFSRLSQFQIQYKACDHVGVQESRKLLPSPLKTVWNFAKCHFRGFSKDEFGDGILKFFDSNQKVIVPLRGTHLDPKWTQTVILGHSHHPRNVEIPGVDGGRYYNTGGWLMRYENGHQVVNQVWVTISVDIHEMSKGSRHGRGVIDREMIRRKVERPQRHASPMTDDGREIDATLRQMTDLRVGDVVLFRWNFGSTFARLLRESSLLHPKQTVLSWVRTIPAMIPAWFNRKGTSSAWNHVAIVYASPAEQAELDNYNEPLFLEAVPTEGVKISRPIHYMKNPKEWDLAVLRLDVHWLKGTMDGWDKRRLLRRIALGNLNKLYDDEQVMNHTIRQAVYSMDERGRSALGGLVKGAFGGVALGFLLFVFLHLYDRYSVPKDPPVEEWFQLDWTWIKGKTIQGLDRSHIIPFVNWEDLEKFFSSGTSLNILGAGIWASVVLITLFVSYSILYQLGRIGIVGCMLYGATWGFFMIPTLTELAEGWVSRARWTRWFITGLWLAIPVGGLWLGAHLSATIDANALEGSHTASQRWLVLEFVMLVWFALILVVILLTRGIIWVLNMRTGEGENLRPADEAKRSTLGPDVIGQQFLCSTLVHDALIKTAEQVQDYPYTSPPLADLDPRPSDGKPYLPRDFANCSKFRWTYVLHNGHVFENPNEGYKAQLNKQPPDYDLCMHRVRTVKRGTEEEIGDKPRQLCHSACWACVMALCGAGLMLLADLAKIYHCEGKPANCHDASFWGYLSAATICIASALLLTRIASHKLALQPLALQGYVLKYWAIGLSALTVISAWFVMSDRVLV